MALYVTDASGNAFPVSVANVATVTFTNAVVANGATVTANQGGVWTVTVTNPGGGGSGGGTVTLSNIPTVVLGGGIATVTVSNPGASGTTSIGNQPTVTITGTAAATQSGLWTVTLGAIPTVVVGNGTATVTVANITGMVGSVSATQVGVWTTSIGNIPTVSLGNTPTVVVTAIDTVYTTAISSSSSQYVTTAPGQSTMSIAVTGTWTGNLYFNGVVGGSSIAYPMFLVNTQTLAVVTTVGANGTYLTNISGYNYIQVNGTNWASGTIVVNGRMGSGIGPIISQQSGLWTVTIGNIPTVVMGSGTATVTLSNIPTVVMGSGTATVTIAAGTATTTLAGGTATVNIGNLATAPGGARPFSVAFGVTSLSGAVGYTAPGSIINTATTGLTGFPTVAFGLGNSQKYKITDVTVYSSNGNATTSASRAAVSLILFNYTSPTGGIFNATSVPSMAPAAVATAGVAFVGPIPTTNVIQVGTGGYAYVYNNLNVIGSTDAAGNQAVYLGLQNAYTSVAGEIFGVVVQGVY